MKSDIHPQYFPNAEISCACGKTYSIGSTKERIEVEICALCHPFYTGKEKLIDTAGRVDKFKKRLVKATSTEKKAPKKSGGRKVRK
ncbi:MAG: 50S ribosomal protein L31 [Patescibacteria group bacterium]